MSNPYGYVFQFPPNTDDVVIQNIRCTYFNDKQTASGIPADERSYGCALPIDTGHEPLTAGSGIPVLPWGTPVRIWSHRLNNCAIFPLIDVGPAKPPHANGGVDATEWAYKHLGWDVNAGHELVNIRLIGVAHLFRRQTGIVVATRSHGFISGIINRVFPHQGETAETIEDTVSKLWGIP